MKINFLNEAGPFGSYKNRNKETADKARRELNAAALDHAVEVRIDELAEAYLSMLNEIDSIVNSAFSKFTFNNKEYSLDSPCNMHILFNYAIDRDFRNDANVYLNTIKHVYCNLSAIEYMAKLNAFYIPIIDTSVRRQHRTSQFVNAAPDNIKEFCDIISDVGTKTEKILKKHESIIKNIVPGFPGIPTTPKFVNIDCDLHYRWYLEELHTLYNSSGILTIDNSGTPVLHYSIYDTKIAYEPFIYPGRMTEAIQEMMKYDTIRVDFHDSNIEFDKNNEKFWNSVQREIPYLHNKFYFGYLGDVSIDTLSKDNFYSLKMLKHLIDNKVVLPDTLMRILAPNSIFTKLNEISVIKKFIDSNGLTNVEFDFNDLGKSIEYFATLGKKMKPEDAEKEGIDVNSLKRTVYEFDYSNTSTVRAAATAIVNNIIKNGSANIKQVAIDKLAEYIPTIMSKVAVAKPNCISSTNKILLCDFYQDFNLGGNFRSEIRQYDSVFNKKNGSLIIYIEMQFKVPVRGLNPNYKNIGKRTSGKNYEFISGKKIKIEIPL